MANLTRRPAFSQAYRPKPAIPEFFVIIKCVRASNS